MLINGLKGINNYTQGDQLFLVLDCTAEEALAMDTAHVKVMTDAGDLAKEYFGYAKQSASIDAATGYVTLICFHDEDGTGAGLNALGVKVAQMGKQNDDTQAVLAALLGGE